jgi:hypothetical protein
MRQKRKFDEVGKGPGTTGRGVMLAGWLTTPHGTGAIYHALKAADEVAAALEAQLIEEHRADPDRTAAQNPATNSLKLLRRDLAWQSRAAVRRAGWR